MKIDQFKQDDISGDHLEKIIDLIVFELQKAMKKFPKFPTDPLHAIGVMNEESGESTKEALQFYYDDGQKYDFIEELSQTAAMCIRCISGLLTDNIKP